MFRSSFCAIVAGGIFAGSALGDPVHSTWSMRCWRTDEGVPNNVVTGLAQTPDGYLWVATSARFARFDGLEFESFPGGMFGAGPLEYASTVFTARDGSLWVGMSEGTVACLKAGTVRVIKEMPTTLVRSLTEDASGAIWATSVRGFVSRIQDGKVTTFSRSNGLPSGSAASVAADTQGRIWFVKAGQFGIFRAEFETLASLPHTNVNSRVAAAKDGGVWVCSGAQLFRYPAGGGLKECGTFETESGAPDVIALLEDHTGAVWIGTAADGLFRFDGAGFERIPTSHRDIRALMEDNEGNLWAGTGGGGLDRVRARVVELEDSRTGLPYDTLRSICEDSTGDIWAATQNGLLVRKSGGRWDTISTNVELRGPAWCVAPGRDGDVWIGMQNRAIYHFENGQFNKVPITDERIGRTTHALLMTRSGDLWVGQSAPDTIQRLRDGKWTVFPLAAKLGFIQAMAEDPAGNIWIGTDRGALLRVTGDQLTEETPLITGAVSSICSLYFDEAGGLWLGFGGGGLGRLKGRTFVRIGTDQGLYDDRISQLIPDGRGWLWFGSGRGIFEVRQTELDRLADGRTTRIHSIHYGPDEGLESLQANYGNFPNCSRGRDGRLWMPMRNGLAIISPDAEQPGREPPPLTLRRITVDDHAVAWYGGVLPVEKLVELQSPKATLRLAPSYRRLSFEFTALSFVRPENIQFRYRLEGFDEDWVNAGARRVATYPRLSAGTYRFQVGTSGSDGVWSDGPTFGFSVDPFFWQTWWFRLTSLATFTFGVIAVVRYVSFRRLRRRLQEAEQRRVMEEERTRVAQDLHDELGAGLTQVGILGDLAKNMSLPNEKKEQFLHQLTDTARALVTGLDEIVWAVDPHYDSVDSLASYYSLYAQRFLDLSNIACRFETLGSLPKYPLDSRLRHGIFLAFKEALNNVVRHSKATEVRLKIHVGDERLTIGIADNGRGFAAPIDAPGRDGLNGMHRRMLRLGGTCTVASRVGEGTTIELSLPLEKSRT